jgi:hypothetical protein
MNILHVATWNQGYTLVLSNVQLHAAPASAHQVVFAFHTVQTKLLNCADNHLATFHFEQSLSDLVLIAKQLEVRGTFLLQPGYISIDDPHNRLTTMFPEPLLDGRRCWVMAYNSIQRCKLPNPI